MKLFKILMFFFCMIVFGCSYFQIQDVFLQLVKVLVEQVFSYLWWLFGKDDGQIVVKQVMEQKVEVEYVGFSYWWWLFGKDEGGWDVVVKVVEQKVEIVVVKKEVVVVVELKVVNFWWWLFGVSLVSKVLGKLVLVQQKVIKEWLDVYEKVLCEVIVGSEFIFECCDNVLIVIVFVDYLFNFKCYIMLMLIIFNLLGKVVKMVQVDLQSGILVFGYIDSIGSKVVNDKLSFECVQLVVVIFCFSGLKGD